MASTGLLKYPVWCKFHSVESGKENSNESNAGFFSQAPGEAWESHSAIRPGVEESHKILKGHIVMHGDA